MFRRIVTATVLLAAAAATAVLVGWPRPGGECSGGYAIAGGRAVHAPRSRWTYHGLTSYLMIKDDYYGGSGPRQLCSVQLPRLIVHGDYWSALAPRRSYAIDLPQAGLTSVLVVAVWVAAARLIRLRNDQFTDQDCPSAAGPPQGCVRSAEAPIDHLMSESAPAEQ